MTRDEHKNAIAARMRQAREAAGLTCAEIADGLQINPAAYHKYETRSPLPIDLLSRFCLITHSDVEMILNGRVRPKAKKRATSATVTPMTRFKTG